MGASLRVGRRGSTAAWRWDSTAAQSAWQDGSTVVARAAGQHCSWRYVLWPYLCGGNGATWQISGGATWQRGRMAVLQRSSRAGSGAARQRGGGAARQHSSTVIRIDDAAHQHVSLGTGQHASMGRSRAAWQRGSWATGQPGSMQSNRAAQQRGSTEAVAGRRGNTAAPLSGLMTRRISTSAWEQGSMPAWAAAGQHGSGAVGQQGSRAACRATGQHSSGAARRHARVPLTLPPPTFSPPVAPFPGTIISAPLRSESGVSNYLSCVSPV